MFNPDDLKKATDDKLKREKARRPIAIAPDNPASQPVVLMTKKEWLRHYLKESKVIREGYGFKMENGKLVIEDLKRLERFDAETKAILREVYQELR